jgi:hypothetical protein
MKNACTTSKKSFSVRRAGKRAVDKLGPAIAEYPNRRTSDKGDYLSRAKLLDVID